MEKMMKNISRQKISFEVFPPKKEEEFEGAYETLDALAKLNPDFISVTYGAGGSKSKKTVAIASYIQNTLHIPALAHVTCVGNTKQDIDQVVSQLTNEHITQILALRGDRPATMDDLQYQSREFTHASDLSTYLKNNYAFTIGGACYPEKHFEAPSFESDITYLKEKVSTGLSFLITQLFFDNELFYRFLDQVHKQNIEIPVYPGIMPITSSKQLGTTVSLSGSSVPKALADIIAKYGDHPEDMKKAGIEFATAQCQDLLTHGCDGLHLYSMNRAKVTTDIINGLTLK